VDKGRVLLRENETKVVITIGNYLNNLEGSGKTDSELTKPTRLPSLEHYCSLALLLIKSPLVTFFSGNNPPPILVGKHRGRHNLIG